MTECADTFQSHLLPKVQTLHGHPSPQSVLLRAIYEASYMNIAVHIGFRCWVVSLATVTAARYSASPVAVLGPIIGGPDA